MENPFDVFLEHQGFVLLDGGLGTALEGAGCDLNDALWSAKVLMDGSSILAGVHTAFLEAGADVLATCTYQATVAGFGAQGIGESEASALIRRAVSIAVNARNEFHRHEARLRPLVAASVGPYGAYLADGSEYTGDYELSVQDLYEFHQDRWHLLAISGADMMACETLPSLTELRALLRLLDETEPMWAWVSFSCRDAEHLADGTSLAEACRLAGEHPRVAAVGANCMAPETVPSLVRTIRSETALPVIVYPNSGERYDAQTKRWHHDRTSIDLAQSAPSWVAAGAKCVGGCCRTDPDQIRRMRAALAAK